MNTRHRPIVSSSASERRARGHSRSASGIGSPCGSCVGKPSAWSILRLEPLGDHVLEAVGLGVDVVDVDAERLREIELEQAVVAGHLDRDSLAVLGQRDAAVGGVLDEPERGELLHHRASPRRARRPGCVRVRSSTRARLRRRARRSAAGSPGSRRSERRPRHASRVDDRPPEDAGSLAASPAAIASVVRPCASAWDTAPIPTTRSCTGP